MQEIYTRSVEAIRYIINCKGRGLEVKWNATESIVLVVLTTRLETPDCFPWAPSIQRHTTRRFLCARNATMHVICCIDVLHVTGLNAGTKTHEPEQDGQPPFLRRCPPCLKPRQHDDGLQSAHATSDDELGREYRHPLH